MSQPRDRIREALRILVIELHAERNCGFPESPPEEENEEKALRYLGYTNLLGACLLELLTITGRLVVNSSWKGVSTMEVAEHLFETEYATSLHTSGMGAGESYLNSYVKTGGSWLSDTLINLLQGKAS